MNKLLSLFGSLSLGLITTACSSPGPMPIRTAQHVDLTSFMGDWYVISHIPTFLERDAYNAVESYRLLDDGRIATTFSFNDGDLDGTRKTYHPTGFVLDKQSNAIWGMRFIWPFKADYRIVYVDDDYRQTIIGRSKRDFVWIMARSPKIPPEDMQELTDIIAAQGYDTTAMRSIPQQWPEHLTEQGQTP